MYLLLFYLIENQTCDWTNNTEAGEVDREVDKYAW